jgi:hypothetical protein
MISDIRASFGKIVFVHFGLLPLDKKSSFPKSVILAPPRQKYFHFPSPSPWLPLDKESWLPLDKNIFISQVRHLGSPSTKNLFSAQSPSALAPPQQRISKKLFVTKFFLIAHPQQIRRLEGKEESCSRMNKSPEQEA